MIYEWKTKGLFKTDAQTAGEVMKKLENTVGLTAHTLVDASRPESAPLHGEFEWRDQIAAEKYREQQARVLICNLAIRVEDAAEAEPVRAYFTLERNTNYQSTQTIMADIDLTNSLFEVAMRELVAFHNKYRTLEIFKDLFAEIEKLQNHGA